MQHDQGPSLGIGLCLSLRGYGPGSTVEVPVPTVSQLLIEGGTDAILLENGVDAIALEG